MLLRKAIPLIAIVALAACGTSTEPRTASVPAPVSAEDLAKVTLRVGDQKGGSKSLLTAAGLLDNLPYKIEWATFAAAAKAKIAAVSSSKGNTESDVILVPADSPLTSVKGLRGKTIGVAKGSSAHGQVLYSLRAAGLSTKDVKLSFLQPADAYGAFNQKQIDAWAVWDPCTSQAILESHARVLVDGADTANGYSFLVAGTDALSDAGVNSALCDYVVRHAEAERWADTHREDGVLPGAVDFGAFVDRRFRNDIVKG